MPNIIHYKLYRKMHNFSGNSTKTIICIWIGCNFYFCEYSEINPTQN